MKNNNSMFNKEKMDFLLSSLKMSIFLREIKKVGNYKVEINTIKNWIYLISQNISENKEMNKIILNKLKEDFERLSLIFKNDIFIIDQVKDQEDITNKAEIIENIKKYNEWIDFFDTHIYIEKKNYLKKKWLLIYLIEDTIELNEEDEALIKNLEEIKDNISKINYLDENNSYEILEKKILNIFNSNKKYYPLIISGFSLSKSYIQKIHNSKEWEKIFKKYSNEKILNDDSSSKYMDIIKLKGYIHWLEFFSKNRPLNLVTN